MWQLISCSETTAGPGIDDDQATTAAIVIVGADRGATVGITIVIERPEVD